MTAQSRRKATIFPLVALITLLVSGCAQPSGEPSGDSINDPFEVGNRHTHEFNRNIDRALVRPAGVGYTKLIPDDIEDSIGNFAANLGTPSAVVNNLLQGNIEAAFTNTMRFVFNSTIGFGGLFDVASDFEIEAVGGDFGQTLYVWGVPEGAYMELPIVGPSTERATVGRVVDLFTNPLSYVLPNPQKYYGTAAGVASKVGDRGRYAEAVDSILYDSADSYSQARSIYLQNRKFQLGDGDAAEEIDPFDLNTEGF